MKLILFTIFLSSCSTTTFQDNYTKDISDVGSKIQSHPTRSIKYWPNPTVEVANRVFPASEDLIKLSILSNAFYGDEVRASAIDPQSELSKRTLRETESALRNLPDPLKPTLNEHLQGVYLLRNLGSTAMTYGIYDDSGAYQKSIILLDVDALNHKANSWSSWKESTVFEDGAYTLSSVIEDSLNNTTEQAIQYILLHEIGHLFASAHSILPDPGHEFGNKEQDFPFVNLSWKFDDAQKRLTSDEKGSQSELQNVAYYSKSRRKPNKSMLDTYVQLQKSSFLSLYGSTNVHDDFAEAFAVYVHKELMKKPWKIDITREGESILTFVSCTNYLCLEKTRFICGLLAKTSTTKCL